MYMLKELSYHFLPQSVVITSTQIISAMLSCECYGMDVGIDPSS